MGRHEVETKGALFLQQGHLEFCKEKQTLEDGGGDRQQRVLDVKPRGRQHGAQVLSQLWPCSPGLEGSTPLWSREGLSYLLQRGTGEAD